LDVEPLIGTKDSKFISLPLLLLKDN
jgi:hypothetical protein